MNYKFSGYLGLILLTFHSIVALGQFPLQNFNSLPFPNMNRPGASGFSTTPQNSKIGRREVLSTPNQKKISDSIVLNRNLNSGQVIADTALINLRKKIYGYSIFNNKAGVFDSNLKIATPKNYVLGPDDEIIIDINGYSEEHYNLTVNPDGFVKINRIGNVFVAGLTIDEAKSKLVSKLSTIYYGLRKIGSGPSETNLYASISLGSIRTIGVVVQGEVMFPGTYSVPSLARVINVLHLAGGPNENGTFREIQLIRNNRVVSTIDLYEFLSAGFHKGDMMLHDQDVIRVGVYKSRIEIQGKVKHEGYFEVLPKENLKYALETYAGGFSEDAFREFVKVTRYTSRERKLIDLQSEFLDSFIPNTGDLVQIESINQTRYENKVEILGEVFRPGKFALEANQSLLKLIERAGGLKENAFTKRILIERLNADLTPVNLSINLQDLYSKVSPDVSMQREDKVTIFSIFELRENYTITVHGEINGVALKNNTPQNNMPKMLSGKLASNTIEDTNSENINQYELPIENESEISEDLKSNSPSNSLINRQVKVVLPFVGKMTVEDVILLSGGLRESAATGFVEIVRRKKNIGLDSPELINSQIAEIIKFPISKQLQVDKSASTFELVPFDEVFIRSSPNYELQQFITLQGQVVFPGIYGLEKKDERLSELINRAGGLNKQAYPAGAKLIRSSNLSSLEKTTKNVQFSGIKDNFDGIELNQESSANITHETIGIDLVEAMKNPGSEEDLFINEGDVIDIPREPQIVKLSGEVLYPNNVKYNFNKSLRDYISSAGGYTSSSARRRSFVLYSNGSIKRVHNFLFLRFNPKIERGAEIVVPKKTKSINASQQIVSLVSVITGSVTSIIGIITLIKATAK